MLMRVRGSSSPEGFLTGGSRRANSVILERRSTSEGNTPLYYSVADAITQGGLIRADAALGVKPPQFELASAARLLSRRGAPLP